MGRTSAQLAWDFPQQPPSSHPSPHIWLISGSAVACEALRRRLSREEGPHRTTCILDVETGEAAVGAEDLIVVKERGIRPAEIFIPVRLKSEEAAAIVASASDRLRPVTGDVVQEVRGLTLIGFEGWRRVSRRRGWARSVHERTLDSLACRALMGRSKLVARLCSEALAAQDPQRDTVLEGLLKRLLADALAFENDLGSERHYVAAARLFRSYHLDGLERACRIGQRRQLRLAQGALFGTANPPPPSAFAAFRPVALTGLRLASVGYTQSTSVRAGLRHRHAGSLELSARELGGLLGRVPPPTIVVSLELVKRPFENSRLAPFAISVVADGELATSLGLAGRVGRHESDDELAFVVHCTTCNVENSMQVASIGSPARFELLPHRRGPHDIIINVLTARNAPKIMRFRDVTNQRPIDFS